MSKRPAAAMEDRDKDAQDIDQDGKPTIEDAMEDDDKDTQDIDQDGKPRGDEFARNGTVRRQLQAQRLVGDSTLVVHRSKDQSKTDRGRDVSESGDPIERMAEFLINTIGASGLGEVVQCCMSLEGASADILVKCGQDVWRIQVRLANRGRAQVGNFEFFMCHLLVNPIKKCAMLVWPNRVSAWEGQPATQGHSVACPPTARSVVQDGDGAAVFEGVDFFQSAAAFICSPLFSDWSQRTPSYSPQIFNTVKGGGVPGVDSGVIDSEFHEREFNCRHKPQSNGEVSSMLKARVHESAVGRSLQVGIHTLNAASSQTNLRVELRSAGSHDLKIVGAILGKPFGPQ
jgi:hypothetical protein